MTLSVEAQDYRRGIYLDFEGEGIKQGETESPEPHFAGVYIPQISKSVGGKYLGTAFKDTWQPIKNGLPAIQAIQPFKSFLWEIIEIAKTESRTIFYWSDHEAAVVRSLDDAGLINAFEQVSLNIKPIARKCINRRRLQLSRSHQKILNNYLITLCPKAKPVDAIRPGAAEACRRIDSYAARNRRWRKWTERQRDTAQSLVSYNREDCLAVYKLTKKIARAGYL